MKLYSNPDLFPDIQKALIETKYNYFPFIIVLLHECEGIEKVEIHKDKILYGNPKGFEVSETVQHHHCNWCSDLLKPPREKGTSEAFKPVSDEKILEMAEQNPEVDAEALRAFMAENNDS